MARKEKRCDWTESLCPELEAATRGKSPRCELRRDRNGRNARQVCEGMQFECSLNSVKLNTPWAERSAALDYLHMHSRAYTRPHAQIGLRRALYKPQRSSIPPFLPTTTAATLACIPLRPLRRPRRSSSSVVVAADAALVIVCLSPSLSLNNPSSSLSSQRLSTFPHVDLPFSFLVSLLFASPFLVVVRVPIAPSTIAS